MVSFRLKYIATATGLDDDQSIQFQAEAPDVVTIQLGHITNIEVSQSSKRGDLLCTAELHKKATRRISQWLENPTDSLPPGFAEFADDAFDTLAEVIVRTLQLLRWRIGYRNARNPIKFFHSFEWSTNSVTWRTVPNTIRAEIEFGIPYDQLTSDLVASLHELWQSNISEPLAHELFQEAWSQRADNPKSSLVIGVAAAETGMKQLISHLAPSAGWLVQNTQSPPLEKMLKEYFPILPTKLRIANATPPPLPESLTSRITKAVLLRNDIVHGKKVDLESKSLREILGVIHDLLYIFDLHAGHLWAMGCISVETQESWLRAKA